MRALESTEHSAHCQWKLGPPSTEDGGNQLPGRIVERSPRESLHRAIPHLIKMRCAPAQLLGNCWSNYIQTSILRFEKGSVHNWQEENRKEMA